MNIACNWSCSQNIKIALANAYNNPILDDVPVLFVISCRNYDSPAGMRLNHEAYTSYPHEREVMLVEGCPVMILAVEKDVLIENTHESFAEFDGKLITVIHVFNDI